MPDASIPEQVARKIVVRAIQAPCGGCTELRRPAHLHWSPKAEQYLCLSCCRSLPRCHTLREVLQRITKAAAP